MKINIIVFNIIFYFVTLFIFMMAKEDPSSSLGYGISIVIFWVGSLVTLLILLARKLIVPQSFPDKIGIFTATPILCILAAVTLKNLGTPNSDSNLNNEFLNTYSYSRSQSFLFGLLRRYETEYYSVKSQENKDSIKQLYLKAIGIYLTDTLIRNLDSLRVTVDSVSEKKKLVTTEFHSQEITYKFEMQFKDSMNPKFDSLYKWMRNLKPSTDLTINFLLLGGIELNDPDSGNKPTIRIFALPQPLGSMQ
jgi:hypothetical protein